MRRTALVWLILALAAFSRTKAQRTQTAELVPAAIAVSDSLAQTSCTRVAYRDPFVDPPRTHSCHVVSFEALSPTAGRRWSYAVQRHISIYEFADSAGVSSRDTVTEIEMVLYSGRPSAHVLTPVLHGREEEAIIRSITPAIADRSGVAVLSVQFCLNGTGGCWQEFLREDNAGWRWIADPLPAIRSRVVQAFHGDSTHETRAPRIDVVTLRGTAQIASPGDGNCCSSHRAEFQLALDGDRFRVVRLQVIANER